MRFLFSTEPSSCDWGEGEVDRELRGGERTNWWTTFCCRRLNSEEEGDEGVVEFVVVVAVMIGEPAVEG